MAAGQPALAGAHMTHFGKLILLEIVWLHAPFAHMPALQGYG